MTGSLFGNFTAPLASFVSLGVIAAAIALHAFGRPDSFVDNLAFAAFGVIFGVVPAQAGASLAAAAHKRLDAIHAPSSEDTPPA